MRLAFLLSLLLAASSFGCEDTATAPRDTGATDAVPNDAVSSDARSDAPSDAASDGTFADATTADLVAVSHPREMRGAWIATVSNLDWPSRTGLSADAQQAEMDALLDKAVELRLNAIFFQVRAEADAFYESSYEPWSRYLSGEQGISPSYDPLQYAIEAAHARGLELHAWLNPYRAGVSRTRTFHTTHVSNALPGAVRTYNNFYWLDPGSSEAEEHTLAVVREVLTSYDLDGLHFDDYFYPYPDGPFPDDAEYAAYTAGGGSLSLGDWRRDNVNRMVRRIGELVAEVAPDVRFGISPFGIYRPGIPEGIRGLDQYDAIYADPPLWLAEGWVDYLAPQLYWPSTRTAQAFEVLANWWGDLASDGRSVWAGCFLSRVGSSSEWPASEFAEQIRLSRASLSGTIQFRMATFMDNTEGISDLFRDTLFPGPAASPPAANANAATPPTVTETAEGVRLAHPSPLRVYALYREGDSPSLEALLPAMTTDVPLETGTWLISAIDRRGAESMAVRIVRP